MCALYLFHAAVASICAPDRCSVISNRSNALYANSSVSFCCPQFVPANAFKTLFILLTLLATCTQWALNEKNVSRYTPSSFEFPTRGSSVSEILIFGGGGYWPALGLGWTGLLSTLVLISRTSYLVGNRTSLSGSRWSCAPVPESWLPRHSISAWQVLSAVAYQLDKHWITLEKSCSLAVCQCGLSLHLTPLQLVTDCAPLK